MNLLNRILDFFWWNRANRDEEREWEKSGSYPDVVERTYRNDRDFQRDASRLKSLGYHPGNIHQKRPFGSPWKDGDVTELIHVTYEREDHSLLAPGTESSDPPKSEDSN